MREGRIGKGRQREREREGEGWGKGDRGREREREREGRKERRRGEGEIYIGKCGGGIRAKEIAYANLQNLYSLALIPHSLYDLRHREACAALDSPLTPCTTTGTKQPVLHSSPPLTPWVGSVLSPSLPV